MKLTNLTRSVNRFHLLISNNLNNPSHDHYYSGAGYALRGKFILDVAQYRDTTKGSLKICLDSNFRRFL